MTGNLKKLVWLFAVCAPTLVGQGSAEKVESCLQPLVVVKGEPLVCHTLASTMAEMHVPGVSVAVIHNGTIEWARGYGSGITPATLFQAGSISKPLASMGALRLVQERKLSLDADVNATLRSWQVPPSAAAPDATVTLRELLTHTAGFTVHGFPGYAAGEAVPTLVEVLNGTKPANTAPIRLESVPGSKWNYSGGGFTVMQQLVLDVVKEPYPKFLQDTVLTPIGMTRSTYEQPPPAEFRAAAAMPYDDHGTAIPGGPHTYPEMAAAGLWTTPSDLGRYIIEVQQSLAGHANHVLSQEMTKQMLTAGQRNWGLGLQLGGSESNPYFSHGGVNEGYESLFVGYEKNGDGAVVMTNAEGGTRLADEVMSAIATAYQWPDFHPVVRTQIKLDRSVLARYVGVYELTPTFTITVTLERDQLMAKATNQATMPIYPKSEKRFFWQVLDAEIEFGSGYLILHQGDQGTKAMKK